MEDEGGMTKVHDVIVLQCLYKAYQYVQLIYQ